MTVIALLLTAIAFGGMVLFSFGFAAFLFTALPPDAARTTIRRAFPHFYTFVIGTTAVAAAVLFARDGAGALVLAAIAATTVPTRQVLMPAINRATDAGDKRRFNVLHGFSVAITLAHITASGYVLARFLD